MADKEETTMRRADWIRIFLIAALFPTVLAVFHFHVVADPALAQDMCSDISSGRRLAEAWCSECHSVELKTAQTKKPAPGFTAIAKRESTTALALNSFLRSSHNKMPNFIVKGQEADAIVAYILSLKRE